MNKSVNNLMFAWIAIFILALIWLLRPKPEVSTPTGWKIWSQPGAIYAMIPYKDGVLTGGVQGLWYSDGNTTVSFQPFVLPKGAMVFSLTYTENRGLWVGHSEGLSIFWNKKWYHRNTSNGLPKSPIYDIALDSKGGWIAGMTGLIRFKSDLPSLNDDKILILPNDEFPVGRISKLLLDRSDNLWIGTNEAPEGGIFMLSGNKITFWGHTDGLPHPQVTSILEDYDGHIWAGTGFYNRGGAAIFARTTEGWKLKRTLHESELAGPKVRSLTQDEHGNYWIGSESNGLAIRNEKKIITILRAKQGLPGEEVTVTVQTQDGAIWLATLKGLVRIDTNTLSNLFSFKKNKDNDMR